MNAQEIKEMIEYFDAKKLDIHIELTNGRFYNGRFVEWDTETVMVFNDRVVGLIHIFINQIDVLEEYRVVVK